MIRNVQIHREFELRTLLPKGIEAGIIRMESFLASHMVFSAPPESPTLVRDFTHASSSTLVAAYQFLCSPLGIVRILDIVKIDTAVELKSFRIASQIELS